MNVIERGVCGEGHWEEEKLAEYGKAKGPKKVG